MRLPFTRPRPAAAPPGVVAGSARAVVFVEPRRVELREVALPLAGPTDLIVDVTASAISPGTERWALLGLRPDVVWPCIPGYLAVGRVAHAADAAPHGLRAGDRVCFLAARCPEGFGGNWMCAHLSRAVVSCDPSAYIPGADLPYWLPVPDAVPDAEAAYAGLAGVAMMGVNMASLRPGETVAIFGLGMVGQFAAQLAQIAGARVFAADLAPQRAERARQCGIEQAHSGEPAALEAAAASFAPGGFDVIIDTTGSGSALNAEVKTLRPHGRFVLQGWYPGMTELNLHEFTVRQVRVFFPCGVRGGDVARALALMASGRLRCAPLITHHWRPDDAPHAYEILLSGTLDSLGQVFDWQP
ncbi:MAG: zinc-binding alcohol dehydrogenase [Candidatus Sumerlaeaceae bacterium]|nr:zinc-binding alcohol dehydrogenase [Candidatus Sumerlaeaceae bacterium]